MATETIIGRVGTAPTVEQSPTGKQLSKFRLARTIWNPDTREEETRWYDVSCWEQDALAVRQQVQVGMSIYVTGTTSVYQGTSGDRHQINAREIGVADRIRFEADDPF